MQATAQLDHIATDPSHSGQQTIVINRAEPIADAIRQKIAEQYCAQLLGSNATDELAPLGETSEMFIRDNDNGYLRPLGNLDTLNALQVTSNNMPTDVPRRFVAITRSTGNATERQAVPHPEMDDVHRMVQEALHQLKPDLEAQRARAERVDAEIKELKEQREQAEAERKAVREQLDEVNRKLVTMNRKLVTFGFDIKSLEAGVSLNTVLMTILSSNDHTRILHLIRLRTILDTYQAALASATGIATTKSKTDQARSQSWRSALQTHCGDNMDKRVEYTKQLIKAQPNPHLQILLKSESALRVLCQQEPAVRVAANQAAHFPLEGLMPEVIQELQAFMHSLEDSEGLEKDGLDFLVSQVEILPFIHASASGGP